MKSVRIAELLAFDRDTLWHPYTSMVDPLPTYPVESAMGTTIRLADGRTLVDGMSSWWCAIHGYGNSRLNGAAARQLEKMSHVMFGGLTHEPAVELGKKLVAAAPRGLERIFLADTGSVAVEVALKMALQYWQSKRETRRVKFLTVRGGYHGDTFGAMAVCDPVGGMHHKFTGVLAQNLFAERPSCRFDRPFDPDSLENIAGLLATRSHEVAAVIIEPLLQGAGGMWLYHPDYLAGLKNLCDKEGVLLILDEIATGFGRTGKYFASEWAGVSPDIMCVGKALTGGYLTLAATLATDRVARTISGDGGVFMHGPTFMGNPLACAVACESLDLLEERDWRGEVGSIEGWLRSGLEPLRDAPGVADVRVLGAVGVVQTENPVNMAKLQAYFVEKGVWIRPFGNLVYLMPPYVSTEEDIHRLTGAIRGAFEEKLLL